MFGKDLMWRRLIIFVCAAFAVEAGTAGNRSVAPVITAKPVTTKLETYDEMLPACSPDGRRLAFEYHDIQDPDYPRVGIIDLHQKSHDWRPLLTLQSRRHLFAGDFCWSPDSNWLALLTDYPLGRESFLADTTLQLIKVNVNTGELVQLTNFPKNTAIRSTTAWTRSGLIVFSAFDDNIYGVPESGGDVRKLINVPAQTCSGVTNTFAVSPDEQRIAFEKDNGDEKEVEDCNALWIASFRRPDVERIPLMGIKPLNPSWVDDDTIIFSGQVHNKPAGLYKVSVTERKVTRLLDGAYLTPFVCRCENALYFSWGPKLQRRKPESNVIANDFYGFRIWRVPLQNVIQGREGRRKNGGVGNLGSYLNI